MTALPPLEQIPGMPDGWVRRGDAGWRDAPVPSRWHRCRPWHGGWLFGRRIERCACGAIRYDGSWPWLDRNARRRDGAR